MPHDPLLDRELLIRLDQKLDGVVATISEIKQDLESKADTQRVQFLEVRVDGLEKRIASHDKLLYMGLGAVALMQAVIGFLLKH